MDSTKPGPRRRIVSLPPYFYVARIDEKLVVELQAEIRDERERGNEIGVALLQRILARVDVNAMDFFDSYDRLEAATYLLVDRYVRPLKQADEATDINNLNFRRPYAPRLLHVMPPPDTTPVAAFRLDVLSVAPGWFEKILYWWKGLSG